MGVGILGIYFEHNFQSVSLCLPFFAYVNQFQLNVEEEINDVISGEVSWQSVIGYPPISLMGKTQVRLLLFASGVSEGEINEPVYDKCLRTTEFHM